ncbi:casein kinase I-like [Teleopsis dalmanni]|uniref:casein kinase I-like n=1 Tax=Teleopsis dalmanni TaxID=139649 RepID=UPI0018CCAE0F|nr:casein kinase I-like [Teleopsis dalmanni]
MKNRKMELKLLAENRYQVIKEIGSGSFGTVYIGRELCSKKKVAIKIEQPENQLLVNEIKIYEALKNIDGFPKLNCYGDDAKQKFLIMDMLGPSLDDLFRLCKHKFTMKTILLIMDQMLERLECIHSKRILHRDLKPANFLIGLDNKSHLLYLIDFGLAKFYKESNRKYPFRKNFVGNVRYASLNAVRKVEQSRRDDLEAVAYMILYFYYGKLPWQGLKAATENEKLEKVAELKLKTPIHQLCKGLPPEFAAYLTYCRKLRYDETPDYKYLRRMFHKLMKNLCYKYDYMYDWVILEQKQSQHKFTYEAIRNGKAPRRVDNKDILKLLNAKIDDNYIPKNLVKDEKTIDKKIENKTEKKTEKKSEKKTEKKTEKKIEKKIECEKSDFHYDSSGRLS